MADKLGVRMDGTNLAQHLATLDLVLGNTTEQSADVVAGLSLRKQFVEHFHTSHGSLFSLGGQTDDLNHIANLHSAALHTTGSHSATAGDREHILDRHQERQVRLTLRGGNVGVNSVHQLMNALVLRSVRIGAGGLQSLAGRATDDRHIVAGEIVGRKKITDLHFNQIKQFGVVHQVGLVHEDNDGRHAHLTGKQHMLAGLLKRTIGSGNHKDSAVHLSSTGDHVLHIVSVAGAVHMGVVTVGGFVLNMTGVDCDTSCLLFGSVVDLVISQELDLAVAERQHFGDGRGQSGLTVVNMTDGTNVNMGFRSFECFLSHFENPP